MKTFKDLEKRDHPIGNGVQGLAFFPNGYGVSVVRFRIGGSGYGSYTDNENEWEVAILKGDAQEWSLTYETPISDDVMGRLSEDDVTDLMKRVQELPQASGDSTKKVETT